MPLPLILGGVAVAGFAGDMLIGNGAIDPEELRHRAPTPGRTDYLPVSGDGGIDGEPASDPSSVDSLDARVEDLNRSALDYEAANLSAYCEGGSCDDGGDCGDVAGPRELLTLAADSGVVAAFDDLMDGIAHVSSTMTTYAAQETIAARLASVYRGEGTVDFNVVRAAEQLNVVRAEFASATEASSAAANEALASVRVLVIALRNILAERAEKRINAADVAWAIPQSLNPIGAAISIGSTGWDLLNQPSESLGPEALDVAQQALASSLEASTAATDKLRAAVGDWTLTPNAATTAGVKLPTDPAEGTAPAIGGDPLTSSNPLPAVGGGGGDTTSTTSDKPETLADLFNEPEPELPAGMSDPGMGSSPMSSPMGGSPMGGGAPMDSGMGSTPLSAPLDEAALDDLMGAEELDEEEPLDDLTTEDEVSPPLDAEAVEPVTEPEPEAGTEPEPEAESDVDADAELPTEPEADAPADDTAARTVDIGNGRQITFPNAAVADAVQRLVDSTGSGGGKTLYMALSESGFNLPPMGQDIGELVPPALLSEGDIVKTEGMMGVFVGAGDVLMENGEVKALTDVTSEPGFGGLFRAEEPAPSSDGLSGPAQPVPAGDGSTSPLGAPTDPNGTGTVDPASASTSTPGDATAQTGTPGVPTDTAADDLAANDTLAGVGMGETDNGGAGLDPSTAFPS